MLLSKKNLASIGATDGLSLPPQDLFSLPERVLQFGTGVFIRGLIDFYIDHANRQHVFNGSVVVVKSTDAGDAEAFTRQDNLYTLIMKSVSGATEKNEAVVCAAISRVLQAGKEWAQILECATNPLLQIIISNTTETGLVLLKDDHIQGQPPVSFPGKLLAFLLKRFEYFKASPEGGMVILPTELIPGNGTKLLSIVNELARINKLDVAFIEWVNTHCDFCNTLVDRIVPGKLPAAEHQEAEKAFGYKDELMIMSETYGLWAIETKSTRTRAILSFSKANEGIHVVDDIYKFLELKLRLLNGSHNLSCALGYAAGFETVKEAMADKVFDSYMRRLILDEIAAAITGDGITLEDAHQFGEQVLERYRNPYINFKWLDICVQDTAKIRIRAVPIVEKHFRKYGYVPDAIAMGFSAYILFMKSSKKGDQFTGRIQNREYQINDDFASAINDKWNRHTGLELVNSVLGDKSFWDADLSLLQGFPEKVLMFLEILSKSSFGALMAKSFSKRESL